MRSLSFISTLCLHSLFFILFIASCPPYLAAQDLPSAQTGEWANPYNTQYASIYYLNDSDLNTFTRSIGKGFTFFGESQEKNPMLAKNRVDAIVERVRRLLDMYPPNLHFKVYIYPTYRELGLKYLGTGNFGKSPIAFYNHKTAAIYISLPDITGGVLAHEIAHTVINFFFAVPPPTAMQEILAQYVDRHLWEE